MSRRAAIALYVVALVVVVVGADVLFLGHHTVERLIANVAIVMAFGAFYLVFLKPRWE